MKKYEPLRAYLANQAPDVSEVRLTFSAIESIIRASLPGRERGQADVLCYRIHHPGIAARQLDHAPRMVEQ